MNYIEMRNIKKQYSDVNHKICALNGVSLKINTGSMVAIVGPSGSGKTTLLNTLGLVIKPTSGEIIIDGVEVSNLSNNQICDMRNRMFGYIVQDYALIEEDTVYENIIIPILYSKNKERKKNKKYCVKEIAQILGISDMLRKPVKKLSGGQRQRVAIARALVNDQNIILADEPIGSLDRETGDMVFSYLEKLVKETKKTLILVTHNLSLAKKFDVIYTLKDGIIIKE